MSFVVRSSLAACLQVGLVSGFVHRPLAIRHLPIWKENVYLSRSRLFGLPCIKTPHVPCHSTIPHTVLSPYIQPRRSRSAPRSHTHVILPVLSEGHVTG